MAPLPELRSDIVSVVQATLRIVGPAGCQKSVIRGNPVEGKGILPQPRYKEHGFRNLSLNGELLPKLWNNGPLQGQVTQVIA